MSERTWGFNSPLAHQILGNPPGLPGGRGRPPYRGGMLRLPSVRCRPRCARIPSGEVRRGGDCARRTVRDGGTRHGQTAPIDAQNRVSLGKALSALGWTPDTFPVAARENGTSCSAPPLTAPSSPRCPSMPSGGSPSLPPAVLGALDVRPGDEVLAGVVVDTEALHLFPVADALQLLIGALPTVQTAEAVPQPARHRAPRAAAGSKARRTATDGRDRVHRSTEDRTGG